MSHGMVSFWASAEAGLCSTKAKDFPKKIFGNSRGNTQRYVITKEVLKKAWLRLRRAAARAKRVRRAKPVAL